MSSALAPTVEALPEGLTRIELPTPFPVGPVNCYVLADHPVTVVDPGMCWADSADVLRVTLAAAGLRPGDVEQIVVTHAHPDHFGAAGWLARAGGAPILCGRPEAPKLADGWRDGGMGTRLASLVEGLGLPDAIRDTFRTFHGAVTAWMEAIDDDQLMTVDDGSHISAGGRSWQVHLTPGHAAGHISLFDAGGATLLGGDHLLARITPNPLLEPDPASPLGRRRSLVEYLGSLERFEALEADVVLSGHGPAFTDLGQWGSAVRAHHAARADEVLDLVRRLGAPSAFELSRALFPHLEGFSHMLGVSEVVGHLDLRRRPLRPRCSRTLHRHIAQIVQASCPPKKVEVRRLNLPAAQFGWVRQVAHSAEHRITRLVATHRDQKLAYLRTLPVFESCSGAEITWLGRYSELCHVPAGYPLQTEGRYTHEVQIVTRGAALSTCRNQLCGMIGPGDLAGDTALLRRRPATCSIRAVEEMEFVAFASQNFTAVLARVPPFTAAVMRQMAQRPLPQELDRSLRCARPRL